MNNDTETIHGPEEENNLQPIERRREKVSNPEANIDSRKEIFEKYREGFYKLIQEEERGVSRKKREKLEGEWKVIKKAMDGELQDQKVERKLIKNGVDFSKCQLNRYIDSYFKIGERTEFESFSPYLFDYNTLTGEVWEDKLMNEDQVGVEIAGFLKDRFPKARMISLYDEYNSNLSSVSDFWGSPQEGSQLDFPEAAKTNFRKNIEDLLRKRGVIKDDSRETEDYLFVSESEKVKDAEKLVERLEKAGFIKRNGEEINFFNPNAENPAFIKIQLRTENGRWSCPALDGSSYIKPENLNINHLVILEKHFEDQQDKAWELLKCIGIKPLNYHNIFFDNNSPPELVVKTIEEEFNKYLHAELV